MKSQIINRCLQIAISANSEDKHPEFRHFIHWSFLIQSNKLIGYATNRSAPPLIARGYALHGKSHSETECWRKCKHRVDSSIAFELVNIRLSRQGEFRVSKPCPNCYKFLCSLGCTQIVY